VDKFCEECLEQIKYYVYALIDTRKKSVHLRRVFYVGKGTGNRCFAHAREEVKAEELSDERLKLTTIREIREQTKEPPKVEIVAHGLAKETDALRLESLLISVLSPIANVARGHRHEDYWISAHELDARFRNPLRRKDMRGTVLLVSLNGGKNLEPYPKIADRPDV
jgi:hypothetical protein